MKQQIDGFIVYLIMLCIVFPVWIITEIVTFPVKNQAFYQTKIGKEFLRVIVG